ncbi:MAG: TetR/AcrR family transcriptional regulator [Acidimicrobiia bacterium]
MTSTSTRDRLVAATRAAIRDVGLPGATAREIAGRASANLAAIPYHFGSKESLVTEALVAEARDLLAPVWALLDADRPGVERAAAAVTLLNDLFDRSRDQVPVYLAALSAAPHQAEVRDGLGALWSDLRSRLADDVAAQADQGLLPAWVDPQAMAALILALVNGVVVSSVVDPDGPDHRAVAGQFLALLAVGATTGGPVGRDPVARSDRRRGRGAR